MKHLSEKQRQRGIRLTKSRTAKNLKRKAKAKVLNLHEQKVKQAARRIGKLQRRMVKEQMRLVRESSNTQ
jgi:hypothetical protein